MFELVKDTIMSMEQAEIPFKIRTINLYIQTKKLSLKSIYAFP